MPVNRSEEYYLPRGDLIIQIEDTLFRIYRGFLEVHSGFFSDMFSTPSSNSMEGTSDEHPLHLPKDLCLAESFTMLCKLICPSLTNIFPLILLKDFEKWEPVLQATEALQMTKVQNYILSRLQDDTAEVKRAPGRLLSWVMRSELPLEALKLKCFYTLAYRRRPLSEAEVVVLDGKTIALVMRVRERIRLLFTNPSIIESLRLHIPVHPSCSRGTGTSCQNNIFTQFVCNLTKCDPSRDYEQNDFDIFRLSSEEVTGACNSRCRTQSNLDEISSSLRKAKLDEEIRQCLLGTSLPSTEP